MLSTGQAVIQSKKVKDAEKADKVSTMSVEALQDQAPPQGSAEFYKNQYVYQKSQAVNKYSKDISTEEQQQLDAIVSDLEQVAPESYEYHYVKYLNSEKDAESFKHLQKAYAIYPNNVELYDDFISYYELTDNDQGKLQFCKKLYESNTISEGIMDYNYNVLMSLEKDAILFTNGSDDTYPAWIWQEIKNVRKDVTILNLDLIQNELYQKEKLKELNIYPIKNTEPVSIVKEVVKNNPGRPINIGLTVNPKALKDLKKKLYLTGLVLKYSETPIDNVTNIKNNWEYSFKKESLRSSVKHSTTKKLNNNYILPLLVLSKHYKTLGKNTESKSTEDLAIKLAKEGGKEKLVKQYLSKK